MKFAALVMVLLTASATLAQTDPERPAVYLWDLPQSLGGVQRQELNMHKMVLVNIIDGGSAAGGPARAAERTRQAIEDQIRDEVSDKDHICIMLLNFGMWPDAPYNYPDRASFIDFDDSLGVTPDFSGLGLSQDQRQVLSAHQPWLRNTADPDSGGIFNVKQWMQEYLDAYSTLEYFNYETNQLEDLPVPARFHFDSEWAVTGCCDIQWVRIMEVLEQDGRWDTMPVPGYGTQTMADLYAQAQTLFGWSNSLHNSIDRDSGPAGLTNRPYWLWYSQICQHVRDAAMNEAGYQLIRNFSSPAGSWANVLCSNYEDANTDGQPDRFGWFAGGPADPNDPNHLRTAINECLRGQTDRWVHGADYDWLYPGTTHERMWLTTPGVASGGMSAPFLYPYHQDYHAAADRPNFYMPDHRTILPAEANLYNNRRWIESVLNSSSTLEDPPRLAPWMPAPEQPFMVPSEYTYSMEEFRQSLAMLRAKNTREVLLWWEPSDEYPQQTWGALAQTLDMVYRPKLNSYSLLTGSLVTDGLPPTALDRLQYTLRYPTDSRGEKLVFQQAPIAISNTVAVQFNFDDVLLQGGFYYLNLELGVTDNSVKGDVFVWDFGSPGGWVHQNIAEFGSSFAFYTDKTPPENVWYDTRLSFPVLIIGDGSQPISHARIKIVLQPTSNAPFKAAFDLVQLVGMAQGGFTDGVQGADYDYSRSVTVTDFIAFLQDWSAGAPAADFNGDGVIDASDVAAYQNAVP
jgi:hypothetical protein